MALATAIHPDVTASCTFRGLICVSLSDPAKANALSIYSMCNLPGNNYTYLYPPLLGGELGTSSGHGQKSCEGCSNCSTSLFSFFPSSVQLFSPMETSTRWTSWQRPRKRQKSQESLIGPRRTSNPLALHFTLWIIVSAPWVLAGGSTLTNATNYLRSEFWNNFRSLRFWTVAIGRLKPTAPGKDIREKGKIANMPKINLQSGDAYVFVRLSAENKEKRNERH